MTKADALEQLRALKSSGDAESAHIAADDILIKLIGDEDIEAAYEAIEKWYA